jgi:hypothetical protein
MRAGGPVASCLVRKKQDLIDFNFIAFLNDSAECKIVQFDCVLIEKFSLMTANLEDQRWVQGRVRVMYEGGDYLAKLEQIQTSQIWSNLGQIKSNMPSDLACLI